MRKYKVLLCILLFVSITIPSFSTSIIPQTWVQLTLNSDFIGIIECVKAGGIIAEYRVIETLKGDLKENELFRLRIPPNIWEPQFPLALCDERYLVFAKKLSAKQKKLISNYAVWEPQPLWCRNLDPSYALPLFQGQIQLSEDYLNQKVYITGSNHENLKSFIDDVSSLLKLDINRQELDLLKSFILTNEISSKKTPENNSDKTLIEINSLKSSQEIIDYLLEHAPQENTALYNISFILSNGILSPSYEYAKSKLTNSSIFSERDRERIIKNIQKRINPLPENELSNESSILIPTQQRIIACKEKMANNTIDTGDMSVLSYLIQNEPKIIADFLVKWKNPMRRWSDTDLGYILGSYFGIIYDKDRDKYLTKLLKAKDDYIRVAAAVYLYFDNERKAIKQLKQFMNLPGDPGIWAALTLARRGDLNALEKSFDVFKTEGEKNMVGVPHRNLQKRLIVLLSNSAKYSNIPSFQTCIKNYNTTSFNGDNNSDSKYDIILKWWNEYGDDLKIHDPWLDELEKQKVD